jgi:hypothetical protein
LQVVTALAPMRDAEAPPAGRRAVLEAFQSACPDYAWIGFADAGGTVIAAASGALEGTKVGDRDWFKGARSAPYAGEMQAAPTGGRAAAEADGEPPRFINLAAPVPAPNGRFLGVLGASLHWSWAREVQTSVVPDSARRERLGVTIYADNGERLLDSGGSGWSEPPGVPKIPFRQRSRGFIWEDAEGGTTYLAGYARSHGFREYPGLNVLVVVRQPARVVLAPVRELQSWIWWLGVALAAGAVLASWLFAARLVGALQAVTSAAGRIRGGDVTSLMPRHHGFDEAAQMTGALGAMVDAFRRKQDELEANNAQLEKRLRERRDPPPPPGGI